jgi:hypothetical protein
VVFVVVKTNISARLELPFNQSINQTNKSNKQIKQTNQTNKSNKQINQTNQSNSKLTTEKKNRRTDKLA